MNPYNPYAAPTAERLAPDTRLPPLGQPQAWTATDAIGQAWGIFKIHWAPLVLGYFIMGLVAAIPGQVPGVLTVLGTLRPGTAPYWIAFGSAQFFSWLITTFFTTGFIKAALKAIRGTTPTVGDFFSAPNLPSYFATVFLCAIVEMIGFALLIVPGVILTLGLANAPFYCIDRRMGPIEAMKASWESTNGQKGDLFVFALLETGMLLAGMLACCLGLFVAAPLIMVSSAFVYTRMSGSGLAAAPPPPSYGPPGGYGPPGYGGAPPSYGGPPPGGFGGPQGY